jgi:hypothetical protein
MHERDGTTSGHPWVWRIPFMSARRQAQGGGGTLCLTSAPRDSSTPEAADAPAPDPGSPSDAR